MNPLFEKEEESERESYIALLNKYQTQDKFENPECWDGYAFSCEGDKRAHLDSLAYTRKCAAIK